MIQVWILTIWLVGNPVPVVNEDPFPSASDCAKEGARQVRDYQRDHIEAYWACEDRAVEADEQRQA